jgi:hypothetical protein
MYQVDCVLCRVDLRVCIKPVSSSMQQLRSHAMGDANDKMCWNTLCLAALATHHQRGALQSCHEEAPGCAVPHARLPWSGEAARHRHRCLHRHWGTGVEIECTSEHVQHLFRYRPALHHPANARVLRCDTRPSPECYPLAQMQGGLACTAK